MYFAIAYDLWPHLTGRALDSLGLMRAQLWLWFVGMIVTTFPWHYVGILGMPRRMAFFDYTDPAIAPQAAVGDRSRSFGGVHPGRLGRAVLRRPGPRPAAPPGRSRARTASAWPSIRRRRVPAALNGYALWLALMIGLTVINYGFPIAQLCARQDTSVPAVYVGAQR